MSRKLKIGITNCGKFSNYENWIINGQQNIEVLKLSYIQDNAAIAEECDGIIFSGGEDVHPKFYNKPNDISFLNPKEINEQRDVFELKVIEKSLSLNKPVLGICRGLQIINVYLGGSLIYDIPTITKNFEHSKIDGADQRHAINIIKQSLLYDITLKEAGEVNSAHHQSVDEPAKDLKVIANSSSIVEGMQWKNPENKSWLLLVQWHPERMFDQQNSFAAGIKNAFLKQFD